MTMQGRFMLKSEAIEWNEPWSQRDRARIAAALEAIPGGKCIRPSSGERIGVWINGHLALKIYPGYLVWPGKGGPRTCRLTCFRTCRRTNATGGMGCPRFRIAASDPPYRSTASATNASSQTNLA